MELPIQSKKFYQKNWFRVLITIIIIPIVIGLIVNLITWYMTNNESVKKAPELHLKLNITDITDKNVYWKILISNEGNEAASNLTMLIDQEGFTFGENKKTSDIIPPKGNIIFDISEFIQPNYDVKKILAFRVTIKCVYTPINSIKYNSVTCVFYIPQKSLKIGEFAPYSIQFNENEKADLNFQQTLNNDELDGNVGTVIFQIEEKSSNTPTIDTLINTRTKRVTINNVTNMLSVKGINKNNKIVEISCNLSNLKKKSHVISMAWDSVLFSLMVDSLIFDKKFE